MTITIVVVAEWLVREFLLSMNRVVAIGSGKKARCKCQYLMDEVFTGTAVTLFTDFSFTRGRLLPFDVLSSGMEILV